MTWLILAVLCMISWGLTDILYKKGSTREDELSCYKFMVWLGMIMGIVAIVLLPESESGVGLLSKIGEDIFYILIRHYIPKYIHLHFSFSLIFSDLQ